MNTHAAAAAIEEAAAHAAATPGARMATEEFKGGRYTRLVIPGKAAVEYVTIDGKAHALHHDFTTGRMTKPRRLTVKAARALAANL